MCRVVRALLSVVVVAAVLFVIIAPAQATNYVNENNGHSIKLPSETIALTPLKIQQMKQKYHAFMERKGLPIPKSLKEDPNFLADLEIHEQAKKAKCTFHTVCNEFACTPVCEIGSVQIDSWLLYAMETQRNLQLDTPLNYLSLPGSHNAAITKATGVGIEEDWLNSILNPLDMWVYIANNQFSLTDQMNMGVRHLELDIHWFNGEIRICHAGGIHIQMLDELMKELGIDWDSESIGCFNPWGRTLNDTFVEINKWINNNPSEFLMFYFDDQYDLENWGKVPLLMEAIHYHFGDFVLTPTQKNSFFPNGWPTQRQLIRMGKQVLFASRSNYALQMNSSVFYSFYLWNEWNPDTFIAYPRCVVGGNSLLGNGTMERVLADSLIYGPFWNGYGGGVITQSVLEGMSNCGTNFMSSDQVSPILMEGAVWSWAKGEPSNMKNGCVSMGSDGRWKLQDCNTSLPYVCQRIGTLLDYTISTSKGPWAKASCPAGYQFAVPTNGLLNTRLHVKSNGANLWINFTV